MKSFRVASSLALLIAIGSALPAAAADKSINLSLFTPVSLAKADEGVTAFRFNLIYGRNTSVGVVDLGLVNHTTKLSHGLQLGTVNFNEGAMGGLQIAAVNFNKGATKGLEWGTFNYAEQGGGLQLAVVNYAGKMDGVQIGMINIIREGGFLPVCIIANWGK